MDKKHIVGSITGIVAILAVAAFVILGFTIGAWQWAWLVFLAIPITAIVGGLAAKDKDIPGAITGLVAVLCAVAFFVLGFLYGLWHPGWLVFLAIPITAIIAGLFSKKKDIPGSIVGFVTILAAVAFFILGFTFNFWHPGWVVFLAIPLTAIIAGMFKKKPEGTSGPNAGPGCGCGPNTGCNCGPDAGQGSAPKNDEKIGF